MDAPNDRTGGGHARGARAPSEHRNGAGKRARRHKRRTAPGASPGTLVADPTAPRPRLSVLAYSATEFVERAVTDPREVRELLERFPVVWFNVDGLGDVDTIRAVGDVFGLHRLELEDVVNVHQRPKVDRYGEHEFVVARMVNAGPTLETEQLSLFFGRNFVLTFQEFAGDGFGPVRDRLRNGTGSLRASGPDYLAYALLDATVDQYFAPLEALGERLEALEDEFCTRPRPTALQELHRAKRDLLTLRRCVWPLREALSQLQRDESGLIQRETRPYLNDLYDHTVQIMDVVETYRELASGLLDIYLSSMSHRLNEVMMVLTVIATIFIPLTFLSSIWGMNFEHMPELKTTWGYPVALASMVLVACGLLAFFRRRGWIGPHTPRLPVDDAASHARSAPRGPEGSGGPGGPSGQESAGGRGT
ncbi:MAG: magnesium/cobalt transporter CorA [Planctomycetes bacterium]|nr:magnesium/cobalt transporter CorA [Planctomycetota bacterium]